MVRDVRVVCDETESATKVLERFLDEWLVPRTCRVSIISSSYVCMYFPNVFFAIVVYYVVITSSRRI